MGQSTEELSSDIAGTRQNLAADLDALQDRVSPSAIVDRRKAAARSKVSSLRNKVMGTASHAKSSAGSTTSNVTDSVSGTVSGAAGSVQDAAHGAADTAQEKFEGSPLAAGLVAFGAGVVLAGMFPATRAEARAAEVVSDAVKDQGAPLVEEARSVGQDVGQSLKESATERAQQVKESAAESASKVQGEGQSAAESVRSDVQGS